MTAPRLIVGLGNPGPEYETTRHNVGFWFVDQLADKLRISLAPQSKFFGRAGRSGELWLLEPTTYMNRSGQSVAALANFYKIPPAEILVIHDDLDLPPGGIRIKQGGGNGGHNGLKSIDQHLGQNYRRVRLGIGHPGDKDRVAGYVLHDFAKTEQVWLEPLVDAVAEALPLLLKGDEAGFMNRVSVATAPPKKDKTEKPAAPQTAAPKADPLPSSTPSPAGAIADALRAALARKKD